MRVSAFLFSVGLVVVLAVAIFAQSGMAGNAPTKVPQTLCPLMGEKINRSIYADYQGKRVYFCCKSCLDEFAKAPANTVKQVEGKGIILDAAQVVCPVSGGRINREIYADYGGRRIYFSSKDCLVKFNHTPAQYAKKLDQDTASAVGK
jgi:YHS domain-containing protein